MTAYVDVDKNLIVNGSPEPINLVINDLVAQIARKLDYTILKGNASAPVIAGVDGTTGVNTVVIADVTKATFQDFLKFGGAIDSYEMVDAPEFIMSASDKALLKGISKDTGSGRFICEDNQIDGYNVNVCGALASGEIYFGNFANVIVGNWLSGLEIVIDPYSLSRSGGYRIVATMIADVAVTNPNGFVKRVSA